MAPDIRAELRLHPDVQTLEDEWSGITDPGIRRKLQNRLNQRAASKLDGREARAGPWSVLPCRLLTRRIGRRKAAAQKNVGKDTATPSPSPSGSSSSPSGSGNDSRIAAVGKRPRIDLNDLLALKAKTLQGRGSQWNTAAAVEAFGRSLALSAFGSIRSKYTCQSRWYEALVENRVVEIEDVAERMQNLAEANAWMYPLPSDHLITLVYYNVYRALIANVEALGLDLNLMYTDDYPSPFLPLSPTATSRIRRLPPSLEPTELQRTMAHHPQWDIFPYAELRDNILQYGEANIDDLELCIDMVGDGCHNDDDQCGKLRVQEQNGLIVWGEPWDDDGWEVTETFARKWHFLIRGAHKLQRSTNHWRLARDEEPLDFEKILEIE